MDGARIYALVSAASRTSIPRSPLNGLWRRVLPFSPLRLQALHFPGIETDPFPSQHTEASREKSPALNYLRLSAALRLSQPGCKR